MDVNRRTLLKVLGLTAAGSALPGCERDAHRLIPYLLPDGEIVPGVANWYASVCGECDAGCGIVVRVMEGRAKKIEGHPDHPLNRGKHCAKAEAALQALYHPDRLPGPMKRSGRRGEGSFQPVSWDEAIAIWVEQLRRHAGRAAIVSAPLHGTLAGLFSDFARALDADLVLYQPGDLPVLRAALPRSFGINAVPYCDLSRCDYLLSFGAPFLHDWLSPVHYAARYGEMRQGRPTVRGRFVQVEPRLSMTGACADKWIPVRPGNEALLALGIGQALLQLDRVRGRGAQRQQIRSLFTSVPLSDIAARTDVSEEEIINLAQDLARASAPLVIAGGAAACHTNGTLALRIAFALNRLLTGHEEGQLRFYRPEGFPDPFLVASGAQALMRLAEDVVKEKRTLLHLHQADPLYSMPPSSGITRMFEEAAFTVSFSSFLDESTAMADLILPNHTGLESWGDHPLSGSLPEPVVGLRQPVVQPVRDSRFVGDLLLEAARRVNDSTRRALPWPDFNTLLHERWEAFIHTRQYPAGGEQPFDQTWVTLLQQGGWWGRTSAAALPASEEVLPQAYEPAVLFGDPPEFPLYFHPYPSPALGYGEGAAKPWLQELPDPLTTIVWDSWLEMNPGTARELGVRQGDLVHVISSFGQLTAPVIPFPGIRPDVVAMPIGWGHRFSGRYAAGRGANPFAVLGPALDSLSGALAMNSTRVRVEPTGERGAPIFLGAQIDTSRGRLPA